MTVLERFRLDNKTALVTGGNRGLGKQMSLALAEAGANVAIISRRAEEANAAAGEVASATGRTCRGYACDVAVPENVDQTVSQVLKDFGKIDILVNNAGINARGAIDKLSVEDFRRVQETNVTGPWLLCKALAAHFKDRRYGRVVNMGSTLSVISLPDRTPYSASKGAVLQLTRALALEWAPYAVTVNCIMPGPFGTEMNQVLMKDPKVYQEFIAKIPLGRWGNLEEIGGLVVFLASDASSFITGAAIAIDGGWIAH
ncbi:MAG TPA: glucose 1-dehydrogenase [Gemmataceae bacterium]|nr:glucose 1-dehydrogenase [Gemmataceae bacterium]